MFGPATVNNTFTDNCGGGSSTVHTQTASGNATAYFASFNAAGRYVEYTIPGFSEFWLSGTTNVSPLPIELTAFTASCQDNRVLLEWTTASEINNEKFVLDRSSDLQDWKELKTVSGSGNSNEPINYSTVDERPLNGLSYYRLTQVDYDGQSESFAPVSITCYTDGKGNSMMLYPNPANERFTVSLKLTQSVPGAQLEIMDITGKVVLSKNVNLTEGINEFTFDRAQMSPGQYIIRLKADGISLAPVKLVLSH